MIVKYRIGEDQAWQSFELTWFGHALDYAIADLKHLTNRTEAYVGSVTVFRVGCSPENWRMRRWTVTITMPQPRDHATEEVGAAPCHTRSALVVGPVCLTQAQTCTYKNGDCPVIEVIIETTNPPKLQDQHLHLSTEAQEVVMIAFEASQRVD